MNARSSVADRRRGTAYLIVLGSTMLVGTIAFAALGLTRARGRAGNESMDATHARQCALDGVEIAKLWIRQDANWRINRTAGVWATDLPTGPGTVSIEVADPVDGNLARGQHDALFVKCTGKKGQAKHILSVTLQANPIPLDSLAYAAHAGGEFHIRSGKTLKSAGGVISSNQRLRNDGTITGGIHVNSVNPLGIVRGTPVNTAGGTKPVPSATIIDKYAALGTELVTGGSIDKKVIAPGYTSYGPTNPNGVYVCRTTGNLTIKNSRIHGTLVVIIPSDKQLQIDNNVLIHPYRTDYPTIICSNDGEFQYQSGLTTLSETVLATNFNPPGAPYNGVTNILPTDLYPSEIQGLVHFMGKLKMKQTARIRGVVLTSETGADSIDIEDTPELIYTPSLFTSPPQWYTKEVRMPVQLGTWSQPAN
jgi:hypothetical protein